MQHLDEGFLHALADGEVPSDELGPVREHLESCESCRARLDEARMEAETARELIEMIDVPALIPAERRSGVAAETTDQPTIRPGPVRWTRPLALAASLVLAAGIGYFGRGSYAPFAQKIEPTSLGRIDTVFLDIPAEAGRARENESNRNAELDRATNRVEPQAPAQASPPARSDNAGALQGKDEASKQKARDQIRPEETVMKAAAAPPSAQARRDTSDDKKEAEDKLSQGYRQRAASDSRGQVASNLARKPAAEPAAPPAVLAEERSLAKTAADAAAVVVTFPRAVELLGGRIKLIEGMVPARLEAMGKVVRVIYTIDEGDVVLAQVSGVDSVLWSLSGPLSADSLARLRVRVR